MSQPNIDPEEINKFSELATHWWDTQGEMKSLHDINPLRLNYIDQHAPLKGKKIIDIGCGGGILSETMDKAGGQVTGLDMSKQAIQVAKLHQHESGTHVDYFVSTAEDFAIKHPGEFDVITCLEMLEHVPDPSSIVKSCAELVKPGGSVFFSTLNRNIKSYLFAIIGAEYVLNIIPKNTHDYAKFIRPSELSAWARKYGLTINNMKGLTYNPLNKTYRLCEDISVNYLVHMIKT
jgi:2-polyprenyl-6-hydroxyphenyl methylase/3-demethylubiquinone-9 3-methyltransferase